MAQAMLHDSATRDSLPPAFVPSALSEIVVLSDFWSPVADIRATLAGLSSSRAHGTLVQIADPAEETFPYSGRVEFVESEGAGTITAGRAETWAADYVARVARHRDEIRAETDRLDWLFSVHNTDRSAAELLLYLHGGMTVTNGIAPGKAGRARMIGGLPSICPAADADRPRQPARAVVAAATDAAAPAPHRLSADAAAVRHRAEGRNARAYAVVADAAAPARRGAGHLRRRRTDLNPQTGGGRTSGPLLILIDDGWSAAASWDMRIKAADELIAGR
jgi:hypothetical protein